MSSIQSVPVRPDQPRFQTNIVQTIINSVSVFKDFGQHSRWISPDNIDYYKSRRMVSISKSSSGSPINFQFQSANTGSTLTSHEVHMQIVT